MPINHPGRFIRRVYKEIQCGGSVRPRETRHRDSREARLRKYFETLYRKKPSSISHRIAYLANYLHRTLQVWRRHSTPESHVCVEKCNFEEGIRDQNLMFASKSTIMKKAFDAIISFLHRKMQFRNRHSRPESHVCIEECNFEIVFWLQNCFFASKNAILTKAFDAVIAFFA